MVKSVMVRAIFTWLLLFMICQPFFTRADHLRDLAVKNNANYLAQKAAVDGIVTTALRNEVVNNLTAIGFSAGAINITSSVSTVAARKQRIDVVITAPRPLLFSMSFGSLSQPSSYFGKQSIMSEYLD